MILTLTRHPSANGWTLGEITIDGAHQCWTCEDVVRTGAKIPGETAIPAGRYRVVVTPSPRFGRDLPLLLDVPGFVGIRIHPGNTAADTEGCILPGTRYNPGGVEASRDAFAALFDTITDAIGAGREVWMEITHA